MLITKAKRSIPILIISLLLSYVLMGLPVGKLLMGYIYAISILIGGIVLFNFLIHIKQNRKYVPIFFYFYFYLLLYVIFGTIKLFNVPSGIWPFSIMQVDLALIAFGLVFIFYDDEAVFTFIKAMNRFLPLIMLLFFWAIPQDSYGGITFYILILWIFAKYSSPNIRKIIFLLVIFKCIFGLVQRMDLLFTLGTAMIIFLRRLNFLKIYKKLIFRLEMILPVFFLILALTTSFNVLDISSYYKTNAALGEDRLDVDTRTFLFQEAGASSLIHNYYIFGRTPSYGYDSAFAEGLANLNGDYIIKVDGVAQRDSEVLIVNFFTWFGVIGCLFLFITLYKIGIKSLNASKNGFIDSLVIYLGFFWIVSWLQIPCVYINEQIVTISILIALVSNPKIQAYDNKKISLYLKNILK